MINARDAMPDGGKITIETRNVRISTEYADAHEGLAPGPYVLVAVSDTGAGITEAVQKRVFEPFFTTKGLGRGSGLGLSMVYGFVRQSRGHIKIYSEPGVGTTVKLFFPRSTDELDSSYTSEKIVARRPGPREPRLGSVRGDVRARGASVGERRPLRPSSARGPVVAGAGST